MTKEEKVTLHFDLRHCPQDVKFTLQAAGHRYSLTAYRDAPEKLAEHKKKNKALALTPHGQGPTHFVESAALRADTVSLNSVVYPSTDDHPLPELAVVFMHIPSKHRQRAIRERLARNANLPHPMCLTHYGVSAETLAAAKGADREEIYHDAAAIKPPFETAKTIIFQHPEIGTVNPEIAQLVFDEHVKDTQDFKDLVQYIENHGPGSDCWYQKTYSMCVNPDTGKEEPIEANTNLKDKDGNPYTWPTVDGKPVITLYDLTDEYTPGRQDKGVMGAAAPVIQQVLRDTKDDELLNGLLWTKQTGTTQKVQTNVPPTLVNAMAAQPLSAAAAGWTVKNQTSSYGLDLYADKLAYDSKEKILSFPVKNWPNRYLGVYVEFFRTDGTPIPRNDDWTKQLEGQSLWMWMLTACFGDILQPSSTTSALDLLSAGNQVFGIPFWTNPVTLGFPWPQEANKANVLLGGLGVAAGFRDWDTGVDLLGTIFTGVMCYGITSLSIALTVSEAISTIMKKVAEKIGFYFYAIAAGLGIATTVTGIATWEQGTGKWILSKLASYVAGFIFGNLDKIYDVIKTVVEKLGPQAVKELEIEMETFTEGVAEMAADVSAEEAAGEIPFVGWALKVAAVAGDLASLTATTVECLCSPATYKLEVVHTMDLTVTVRPDPKHGTDKQKPIWPPVSDHYVINVYYPKGKDQEGGTTYVKTGPMPGADTPICVTFAGIPAGGKCEVVASIYSDNNWLAGRWSSGWINADPDPTTAKLSVEGNITENLVPLTPTTLYSQRQRLAYDGLQHVWSITRFSIDASLADLLDKQQPGKALRQAFLNQGNIKLTPGDNNVIITRKDKGNEWELVDNGTGIHYSIAKTAIYDGNGNVSYVLKVQDTTNEFPKLPDVIEDCAGDGHRMCQRVNIIINNKEYQLGYTWRASGQNLPLDYGSAPYNGQMYAFQSVSTLARPEDAFIEPTRGFSQQPYLAFDQFGQTPLFELPDEYKNELNKGGAVSPALAKEFADYHYPLPPAAQIQVVARDKEWQIGAPPLYDLIAATDDQQQNVVAVYAYPLPKVDNFYLDPRQATGGCYHLRGVQFALGKKTFDYSSNKSWGAFTTPHLDAVTVHPHGYVVAVDYKNHKLFTLKLPAEAVDEEKAPLAMPLAGWGAREGLVKEPVSMTIAADGKILILEQGNQRIQAFDLQGNPVQCFAGPLQFALDLRFVPALDARQVDLALVQAFQMNVVPSCARLFIAETSSAAALNQGQVDAALRQAFKDYCYELSDKVQVTTTKKDQLWIIQDTTQQVTYDIRVMNGMLCIYYCFTLSIGVKAPGQEWTIRDTTNAMNFDVSKPKSGNLKVQQLVSTAALRQQSTGVVRYLDIAVENKGYIYVLSSFQQGSIPPVYQLDIYNPDGSVLLDEPQTGVNAAKLTVDQWRSLFTLNYDQFLGSGGRTEPGVSMWIPSTPGKP